VSSYFIFHPYLLNENFPGCFTLLLKFSLTLEMKLPTSPSRPLLLITMNVPQHGLLFPHTSLTLPKIIKPSLNYFCEPLKLFSKWFMFHIACAYFLIEFSRVVLWVNQDKFLIALRWQKIQCLTVCMGDPMLIGYLLRTTFRLICLLVSTLSFDLKVQVGCNDSLHHNHIPASDSSNRKK
jgi:hypothetical protein